MNPELRSAFYAGLRPHNMAPLWEVLRGLVTPEPASGLSPAHWRFADVRPHVLRAGELISAEEAERRVLILENPAAPGSSRITTTLYAGLQLILPGETAPCHRHTQSALRFVVEGRGAFTALNGRRAVMSRWDLVLTPNWLWHDHGNESDAPMIWLDGLDIPLVQSLAASFAEHGLGAFPRANDGDVVAEAWQGRYRRAAGPSTSPERAFIYPYSEWRQALADEAASRPLDEHHGFRLEFLNPADRGPVMDTISAFCQLIPAGTTTRPVRSTDGTVFVVVEGEGHLTLDGVSHAVAPGDVLVAPSWCERKLSATRELVLFSYSDKATQEKLKLWREAA